MKNRTKKFAAIIFVLVVCPIGQGCSTVAGLGRDLAGMAEGMAGNRHDETAIVAKD